MTSKKKLVLLNGDLGQALASIPQFEAHHALHVEFFGKLHNNFNSSIGWNRRHSGVSGANHSAIRIRNRNEPRSEVFSEIGLAPDVT